MFRYEYLIRVEDRIGFQWEFQYSKIKEYNDKGLLFVLNDLSSKGWELVTKENDKTYIVKQKIE